MEQVPCSENTIVGPAVNEPASVNGEKDDAVTKTSIPDGSEEKSEPDTDEIADKGSRRTCYFQLMISELWIAFKITKYKIGLWDWNIRQSAIFSLYSC